MRRLLTVPGLSFSALAIAVGMEMLGMKSEPHVKILHDDGGQISKVVIRASESMLERGGTMYPFVKQLYRQGIQPEGWDVCLYLNLSRESIDAEPSYIKVHGDYEDLETKEMVLDFTEVYLSKLYDQGWKTETEWRQYFLEIEEKEEAKIQELRDSVHSGSVKLVHARIGNLSWIKANNDLDLDKMEDILKHYRSMQEEFGGPGIDRSHIKFGYEPAGLPLTFYRGKQHFRTWFQDQLHVFRDADGAEFIVPTVESQSVEDVADCIGLRSDSTSLIIQGGNMLVSQEGFAVIGAEDLWKTYGPNSDLAKGLGIGGLDKSSHRKAVSEILRMRLFSRADGKVIWAGSDIRQQTFHGNDGDSLGELMYQPVYHIDLMMNLLGYINDEQNSGQRNYHVLVGLPDHQWQDYSELEDSVNAWNLVDSLRRNIKSVSDSVCAEISEYLNLKNQETVHVIPTYLPLALWLTDRLPIDTMVKVYGYFSFTNGLISERNGKKVFYMPTFEPHPAWHGIDGANYEVAQAEALKRLGRIENLQIEPIDHAYWKNAALRCYVKVVARK